MAIKRKKQVVDEVAMAKAISDIKNGLLLSYIEKQQRNITFVMKP